MSKLNIFLTFERCFNYNESEYEFALNRDHVSLLSQLLSSIFSIVNETLRARRMSVWEHKAEIEVKARLRRTVDAHFAEKCLLYLLNYLRKGPVFKTIVGEVNKDSFDDVKNEGNGRERSKANAKEVAVSLAKYAAKHWITH